MTIAELERRSGMTRANIRFYEGEGLISPARRENGYRDYSDEDLEILLRVRLLRTLGVPLSEIREMQSGELGLAAAMDRQIERLRLEQREAADSEAVCRDIRGSGESFEVLDARRWLSELETRGAGVAPEQDSEPPLICPWRRFFARTLDMTLLGVLPVAAATFAFRLNFDTASTGVSIIRTVTALVLAILLEPLALHYFGTTPGKWLLGLSVESVNGGRLSVAEARRRTTGVLIYGMGLDIPIVGLVLEIISWRRHANGQQLRWEDESELRLGKRGDGANAVLYIGAMALVLGLWLLTGFSADMPKNRGAMSTEEFLENYESLSVLYGMEHGGDTLTADGWAHEPSNTFYLDLGDTTLDYDFTEEDGVLTRIELTAVAGSEASLVSPQTDEMMLVAMSYVWGRDGLGTLDLSARNALLREIEDSDFRDFDISAGGVRLRCEVEYSGEPTSIGLMPRSSGEDIAFELRFTAEQE